MKIYGTTREGERVRLLLTSTQLWQETLSQEDTDNGRKRLHVNLAEFKSEQKVENRTAVTYLYHRHMPLNDAYFGRAAQLRDDVTNEDEQHFVWLLAALEFLPDGEISIGCTKFDAKTSDKILIAIMRS